MLKYILKRLLLIIPTLLGVLFIVFAIMNFTPGDPGRQILGISAKQETVDELNHQLGYDRPFLVRFVSYIGDLLQGDLGTSYRTRQPFTGEFFTKVPVTLKLGCLSFLVSSIVGISLGILSAVRQYSFADTFSTITAILFASIPGFFPGNGADICVWPEAGASAYPWDCRMEKLHPACADAGGRGQRPADAADPYHHAGSHPPGFYAYSQSQGLHTGLYGVEACTEKCASSGAYRDGNQLRLYIGRGRYLRNGICHPRTGKLYPDGYPQ